MGFIDHDDRIAGEKGICLHFLENYSVGHNLYACCAVCRVVETHRVATEGTFVINLFLYEFRYADCCNASRLCYADNSLLCVPRIIEDERNLGSLSAPCRAFDDYDLVILQGRENLIPASVYGKFFIINHAFIFSVTS